MRHLRSCAGRTRLELRGRYQLRSIDYDRCGAEHRKAIYDANTIANYDPDIIPFLNAPPGSALERRDGVGPFEPVDAVDWEELSAVHLEQPGQVSLHENHKLVAAGRALADGGDCSYLCDIADSPSHPGREPFYRKFGFLRMKTAMAIFQNPQEQLQRG